MVHWPNLFSIFFEGGSEYNFCFVSFNAKLKLLRGQINRKNGTARHGTISNLE
jgi:hypothetical protein